VAFSPDGLWVASGGEDHTVKLWNAQTGELIRTFRGHSGIVSRVAFSFGPDGKRLASASFDNTVKLWDLGAKDRQDANRLIRPPLKHPVNVMTVAQTSPRPAATQATVRSRFGMRPYGTIKRSKEVRRFLHAGADGAGRAA